jgi:hypothetical protein
LATRGVGYRYIGYDRTGRRRTVKYTEPEYAPLPGQPTPYPPGSGGKIREMIRRAERREQLFHPGDARWEDL